MEKMRNKKERKVRKITGLAGRGILTALELEELSISPHKYTIKKIASEMSKADRVKMRRGMVRNRYQVYNSRIDKWMKMDAKTGKIVGVKKDGMQFKGVRKKRRSR